VNLKKSHKNSSPGAHAAKAFWTTCGKAAQNDVNCTRKGNLLLFAILHISFHISVLNGETISPILAAAALASLALLARLATSCATSGIKLARSCIVCLKRGLRTADERDIKEWPGLWSESTLPLQRNKHKQTTDLSIISRAPEACKYP